MHYKAYFTSEMFYVFSLGLAKFAILVFMLNMALETRRRQVLFGLIGFNAIWLVIAIFAVGFQCSTPKTWEVITGKCFDQVRIQPGLGGGF